MFETKDNHKKKVLRSRFLYSNGLCSHRMNIQRQLRHQFYQFFNRKTSLNKEYYVVLMFQFNQLMR